jgi:hypothetical protein
MIWGARVFLILRLGVKIWTSWRTRQYMHIISAIATFLGLLVGGEVFLLECYQHPFSAHQLHLVYTP